MTGTVVVRETASQAYLLAEDVPISTIVYQFDKLQTDRVARMACSERTVVLVQ